jgi:FAD/FMN-containing dehydrogenase
MKGIRVHPAHRTVRVEAGCVWGDVDHATHAFGMATPCGFVSSTGVAGLTLVGGIGYLTRRFGLTIDNLLAVDMVLADGSFVTASSEEKPDLFWAVRGGGGNFGVVTSFEFRLHPIKMVQFGPSRDTTASKRSGPIRLLTDVGIQIPESGDVSKINDKRVKKRKTDPRDVHLRRVRSKARRKSKAPP